MCFGMCFGLGKTSETFYVLCHPGVHTAHFTYEKRLCALQDGVIWCIFYVSTCGPVSILCVSCLMIYHNEIHFTTLYMADLGTRAESLGEGARVEKGE
jgi:hypothetical protein